MWVLTEAKTKTDCYHNKRHIELILGYLFSWREILAIHLTKHLFPYSCPMVTVWYL